MELIGTHNSGTGEPSQGLISYLVLPFAKCQKKAIHEQYLSGCNMYDIRVRFCSKDEEYHLAHGLWTSKSTLPIILHELQYLSAGAEAKPCVTITYEGLLDTNAAVVFLNDIKSMTKHLDRVNVGYIAVKKPKWVTLWASKDCPKHYQGFWSLDKWYRAIFPIPWIWKLFPQPKEQEGYRLVDFL